MCFVIARANSALAQFRSAYTLVLDLKISRSIALPIKKAFFPALI